MYIPKILLSLFISYNLIFLLLGCKSTETLPIDPRFIKYESLQLDFSLEYPNYWKIFEGSETITISDSQNVLISPENEQLVNKYDFKVSISVAENEVLGTFIEYLLDAVDNTVPEHAPFSRSYLQALNALVSDEEIDVIYNYYELIFDVNAEPLYYYGREDSVVLETATSYNNELHTIYILRKLSQSVVVSLEIKYVEELLEESYFSDVYKIIQSVQFIEP